VVRHGFGGVLLWDSREYGDLSVQQGSTEANNSDVVVMCGSAIPDAPSAWHTRIWRESSDVDDADSLIGPWRGNRRKGERRWAQRKGQRNILEALGLEGLGLCSI
jgi:hypothetical protein